jgi:hypothetical protein
VLPAPFYGKSHRFVDYHGEWSQIDTVADVGLTNWFARHRAKVAGGCISHRDPTVHTRPSQYYGDLLFDTPCATNNRSSSAFGTDSPDDLHPTEVSELPGHSERATRTSDPLLPAECLTHSLVEHMFV